MPDIARAAEEIARDTQLFPVFGSPPATDLRERWLEQILTRYFGEPGREAITEEWLLSVGFKHTREGFLFLDDLDGYLKPAPENISAQSAYGPFWDWKLEPPCNRLLGVFQTRSDIVKLCDALGIELKCN